MNIIKIILRSIIAGIFIALGGMCNLMLISVNQPYFGALSFSIGLLLVCFLDVDLFTGKVGFIFENNLKYFRNIFIMILGNTIGALAVGLLFSKCLVFSNSFDYNAFINNKFFNVFNFDYNVLISFLIRSAFAGIFVFLAVKAFKELNNDLLKAIMIIMSISAMVLTKSEHSIANLFYLGACINYIKLDFLSIFLNLTLNMLFNALGSIIIWTLFKFSNKIYQKMQK